MMLSMCASFQWWLPFAFMRFLRLVGHDMAQPVAISPNPEDRRGHERERREPSRRNSRNLIIFIHKFQSVWGSAFGPCSFFSRFGCFFLRILLCARLLSHFVCLQDFRRAWGSPSLRKCVGLGVERAIYSLDDDWWWLQARGGIGWLRILVRFWPRLKDLDAGLWFDGAVEIGSEKSSCRRKWRSFASDKR